MGQENQNARGKAQAEQAGKIEPRKPVVLKLKRRADVPEPSTGKQKKSLPRANSHAVVHSVDDGETDDEFESGSTDTDPAIEDEDSALKELDDIFEEKSSQGVKNPILKDATHATDQDWEDFFRLASFHGNKEILNLAGAADPSGKLNIKRIINMVFKGQSRLAKIRGVELEVVRKAFRKAREAHGVRERQQDLRKETMKVNGTGPAGWKRKRVGNGEKAGKKRATETAVLRDLDEEEAESEEEAPVSNQISTPEKSEEELEIEQAAAILVQISADAWNAEMAKTPEPVTVPAQMTRQEAAETLLSIYHNPRDFRDQSA